MYISQSWPSCFPCAMVRERSSVDLLPPHLPQLFIFLFQYASPYSPPVMKHSVYKNAGSDNDVMILTSDSTLGLLT